MLEVDDRIKRICGVCVVHLNRGREIAFVRFQEAVQEISAIVVSSFCFPDILEAKDENVGNTCALPEDALPDVAKSPKA